jgi:hypothetical protein
MLLFILALELACLVRCAGSRKMMKMHFFKRKTEHAVGC